MLWGKVKKALVSVLTGVMIIEGAIPMGVMAAELDGGGDVIETDGVSSVDISNSDDIIRTSDKNPGFEGGAGPSNPVYWWYAAGSTIALDDEHVEGSKSMKVTPESVGGGAGNNLSDVLEANCTYQFSFYAKLAEDDNTNVELQAVNGTLATDEESYDFSADDWTKVTGTFSFPESASERHLKFVSDTTTAFYVDDLRVANANLLGDPHFTLSENSPWYTTGGQYSVSDNDPDVGTYGTIKGRTMNWNCIAQDIKSVVKNNTKYNFSFKVKLADTVDDGVTREIKFMTTLKDSAGTQYNHLNVTGGSGTANKTSWTEVKGTLDVAYSGTLSQLEYKMSEENAEPFVDYYVADAKLTYAGALEEVKADYNVDKSLMGIKEAFVRDGLGYSGVCLPASGIKDTVLMEYIQQHYNSVTCENEMKPESFLTSNTNIVDGYPVLDFTQGDAVADALLKLNEGKPEDQQIKMRGHVLVWHGQTPSWFFREGYQEDGSYVSKEVMNDRLEHYIKAVMEHYYGADPANPDSKYKDLIYAWDVVNEQADDTEGIRKNGDWYAVYKGSDDYVTNAFVYANKYAPANVKLFLNDYNDCDPRKCSFLCSLITSIKNTEGARISGMGMQGHHNLETPYASDIENAIKAYAAALGNGEIQITELDFKGSDDYDGIHHDVEYNLQGYRYLEFFNVLKKLNHKDGVNITGVTFWGTDDGHSWLNTFNGAGGGGDGKHKVCPLPFDKKLQAKPAYWAIVDPSKLPTPVPAAKVASVTKANGFASVAAQSFEADGTKVSFVPVWNENGLKVKVTVQDASYDDADAITLLVDEKNDGNVTQYVVKREDCKAIAGGYETIVNIPSTELKVFDKVGFDIKVTNGANSIAWRDVDGKYLGTLNLQAPVLMVKKGSPVSDNSVEWDSVDPVDLTVDANAPEATATAKVLWDEDNLYVRMQVKDTDLDDTSSQPHEKDSVEIFIDEKNEKAGSYDDNDKQYRINYKNQQSFNGESCTAENIESITKEVSDGYVMYAAIKWTAIKGAKDSIIGLDLQINDAKGGARIGTRNLFDNSGNGWSNPSVFGVAKLIDGEIPTDSEEAATYKVKVVSGTGSALYEAGQTVSIKANKAAEGKVFDKWTADSEDVKFADATKEETTFVMPAKAVTVTANYKDATADQPVVTEPEKPVINYFAKFSVKSATIQKGKSSTALAKDLKIAKEDKVQSWTSSNKKIVKVDKNGKITGVKVGKAKITVATVNGQKASITVTVKNNKIKTTSIIVTNNGKTIKNKKASLYVKDTMKLTTAVRPITSPEKVTYSSSNKKVATVSKTGKITAKKAGKAVITVQSGSKKVKITVTVKNKKSNKKSTKKSTKK